MSKVHFRFVAETDRPTLDKWIAMDADHAGKITADFFLACAKPSFPIAVEDKEGIVMFLRFDPEPETKTTRVHIQFEEDAEYRTGKTLFRGFPVVARKLWETGCRRLVFDTINPKLSAFCQRLWGFKQVEGTQDWELELRDISEFGDGQAEGIPESSVGENVNAE
jgi:hypothetical protein